MELLHPPLKYILSAAYLYGAWVHVANMMGLTGFTWSAAPLKWQSLDVAYLILDLAVAAGIFLLPRIGLAAFAIAAVSQIILYSVFRTWVLDVPVEFLPSPEQTGYLNLLVGFHIVTLILVAGSITLRGMWGSALS